MTRYLVLRIACVFSALPCMQLHQLPPIQPYTDTPFMGSTLISSISASDRSMLSNHQRLFTTASYPVASSSPARDLHGGWRIVPSRSSWDISARIPMSKDGNDVQLAADGEEEARGKNKYYKKYKKYMLPLLLAYKLKFFTLVPILIGGLVLLTGATGLAGFFFALFAATMGLKSGGEH